MEEKLITSIAKYNKMISSLKEEGYFSSNLLVHSLYEKKAKLEDALHTLQNNSEKEDIESFKIAMLKKAAYKFDAKTAEKLKNGWISFLNIDALFAQAFPKL